MMMQLLFENLHFEKSSFAATAWTSYPGPGHREWRGGWWRWWPWPGWPPGHTNVDPGKSHSRSSPRHQSCCAGLDLLEAANFARVVKYPDLFHRWDSSSESRSVVFLKYSKYKSLTKLTAKKRKRLDFWDFYYGPGMTQDCQVALTFVS